MKALIAMSGGVDSSVAALLMQKAGYDCMGATMKLYSSEDAGNVEKDEETAEGFHRTCCSLDDVEDARSVAFRLGMRHVVFNFQELFREQVMQRFADCYCEGRTPNPCIDCNRFLKFDRFLRRAMELGCERLQPAITPALRREKTAGGC